MRAASKHDILNPPYGKAVCGAAT